MSRRMTREDVRVRRSARLAALARPELRRDPKPAPTPQADIEAAIAAGRFTRLDPQGTPKRSAKPERGAKKGADDDG